MTAASPWNAETDATLLRLWTQDAPPLSATAIAERMRMTKNQVVGRAHRLKLPPRPSPIGMVSATAPAAKPEKRAAKRPSPLHGAEAVRVAQARQAQVLAKPEPAKVPKPASPRAVQPVRSLAPVRAGTLSPHRRCQMIGGEAAGAATRFCAEPVLPGRSWCAACAKRVFTNRPTWAA